MHFLAFVAFLLSFYHWCPETWVSDHEKRTGKLGLDGAGERGGKC